MKLKRAVCPNLARKPYLLVFQQRLSRKSLICLSTNKKHPISYSGAIEQIDRKRALRCFGVGNYILYLQCVVGVYYGNFYVYTSVRSSLPPSITIEEIPHESI